MRNIIVVVMYAFVDKSNNPIHSVICIELEHLEWICFLNDIGQASMVFYLPQIQLIESPDY